MNIRNLFKAIESGNFKQAITLLEDNFEGEIKCRGDFSGSSALHHPALSGLNNERKYKRKYIGNGCFSGPDNGRKYIGNGCFSGPDNGRKYIGNGCFSEPERISRKDIYNSTILMCACSKNINREYCPSYIYYNKKELLTIVQKLIKYGANVNKEDEYGNTALSLACDNGNFRIAKELIKNGEAKVTDKVLDCVKTERFELKRSIKALTCFKDEIELYSAIKSIPKNILEIRDTDTDLYRIKDYALENLKRELKNIDDLLDTIKKLENKVDKVPHNEFIKEINPQKEIQKGWVLVD